MRRFSILTAMATVLGALVLGGLASRPALASQAAAVADCNAHNRLTRHYSVAELRGALSTMGADVKEYTNCYDVIDSTLLAQIGGSRHPGAAAPGGGSGGSFLSTPVIVVLVLLGLAAVTLGAIAVRRRGASAAGPNRGGGDDGGERDDAGGGDDAPRGGDPRGDGGDEAPRGGGPSG